MIPVANPHAAYLAHREAIDAAVRRVLDGGSYILGPEVELFEREFAAWLNVEHVVGVANGTDAVELALRAIGVTAGDQVVVPAHTATATVAAVERAGAVPLLVDIEDQSYGIDPQNLRDTLRARQSTARITAVVVVHLYGHPAMLDEVCGVAREAGLRIVEDCAQAHGARWQGRTVGSFGDAAAFSFYPTKNLGALGDGGAVATRDGDVAQRLRMLREYGWRERYSSEFAGVNSRLDELQAAILRAKLPELSRDNARRRKIAARYSAALERAGLLGPVVRPSAEHVFHQYAVLHAARGTWQGLLAERGVRTGVIYPRPIHHQPAYRDRIPVGAGGLANSERVCREVVCLPVYPQLSDAEVARVTAALSEV